MGKKTMLLYGLIGVGVYYFVNQAKKTAEAAAAAHAAAVQAASQPVLNQLPTDSMMPGTMPGAMFGLIEDYARQSQMAGLNNLGVAVGITPMRPGKRIHPGKRRTR